MQVREPPLDLPSKPDRPIYFASLIAGLEPIVAEEVRERLPGAELLGMLRGRVFLAWDGRPADVLGLMTVENVFGYAGQLADLPATREGPPVIEQAMREMALEPALALFERLHGPHPDPSFRITAQRSGSHAYNSLDIAAASGAGVVQRYGWGVDLEGFDYDVRVYVTDDTALVGLRLSREALHKRARVAHGAASLNPTVAHAMCRLTGPVADGVFVDPMCGAGTILIERARLGGDPLLAGGDRYEEPLRRAARNLQAREVAASLLQWDARDLPLADGSVDSIACNLPWGRRIGSHTVNIHLYPGFMRGAARVLRPEGLAVLLTQEKRLLTRLIEKSRRLELTGCHPLSLGGLLPSIYVVRRQS